MALCRDAALMRTLVDRHFADCWVVCWGPGLVTDLSVEWDSYKAARAALSGTVSGTVCQSLSYAGQVSVFLP